MFLGGTAGFGLMVGGVLVHGGGDGWGNSVSHSVIWPFVSLVGVISLSVMIALAVNKDCGEGGLGVSFTSMGVVVDVNGGEETEEYDTGGDDSGEQDEETLDDVDDAEDDDDRLRWWSKWW